VSDATAADVAPIAAGAGSQYAEVPGAFVAGHLWTATTDAGTAALASFVQGNRRYWADVRSDDAAEASRIALAIASAQRDRLASLGFSDKTIVAPAPLGSPAGVKVEDLLPDLKAAWPFPTAPDSVSTTLGRRSMAQPLDALIAPSYKPVAAATTTGATRFEVGTFIVRVDVAEMADAAAATAWLKAFTTAPAVATVARAGLSAQWAATSGPSGWEAHAVSNTSTAPGIGSDVSVALARVAGARIVIIVATGSASTNADIKALTGAIDAKLTSARDSAGAGDTNWAERLAALRRPS
jgi:hypothetical protein